MTGDNIHDSSLMDLKDCDKYSRQIGSKALIMTDFKEASEYEEKRRILLEQRNKQNNLEQKVDVMEKKLDKMMNILEQILSTKLDTNNAD